MLIIEAGDARDEIHYRFDTGPRQGERYRIEYMVCDNPLCPCDTLELIFVPLGDPTAEPPARPPNVNLSVWTGTLDRDPSSEADREFTNEFLADLSKEDWRLLQRIFYMGKSVAIEEADFTQLEASFPEEEIEGESALITYQEIIPYDENITITAGGKLFQVDDHHCVSLHCPCTDVHLFFLCGADEDELFPVPVMPEHQVHVILDLKSRKWHIEEEDEGLDIPASELIAVLRKTHDVVRIYKERRRTLRILYRNYRKRITKTETEEEEGGVDPSRRPVGRNDPCPCGSGKKYKKCCLGKDS